MSPTTCTECLSPVDTTALGGICPACMMGAMIEDVGERKAFDGHELLGEIARGGMGVVYRARQLEPERIVALKTMRGASLDSVEARARFKHEAEVMVSLDHPAILPVHHFGEEDGIPFFTMKLADGGTLAQKMESHSGRWREIAALMITLCEAVSHAHERGVLHRDLKPGNVLFDTAGKGYVSDFGIAKLTDARDALTLTLSVLGTPHYLAPEVAREGPKAASVSSDVWSLGVMLFELLTGRRPFEGESVTMVLHALDTTTAPSATSLRKDVPHDLAVITGKALNKVPSQRYATAHSLADDLTAWLNGRPIKARAVPMTERAWLWSQRNPLQAVMAAVLVLALVGAVASLAFGLRAAQRETQRVNEAQAETQIQLRTALLHQARSGRISREMGWRASGVAALRKAYAIQPGSDARDELVAHLAGYDLIAKEREFDDIVLPSSSLKFCVRTKDNTTRMSIARLNDLANLFDLPDVYDGPMTSTVFGPNDQWVAVGTKKGVRVYSMSETHAQLAYWPDWMLIGAVSDRSQLHLSTEARWQIVETATWKVIAQGDTGNLTIAKDDWVKKLSVFHPDPAVTLCLQPAGNELRVIDWRTGAEVQRIGTVQPPQGYRWSGSRLIVSCGDIGQVFDYLRGRESLLGPGFGSPNYLSIPPAGTELLASSQLRTSCLWHLASGQRLVNGKDFIAQQLAADGVHFMTRSPSSTLGRIVRPEVMQFLPDSLLAGSITVTFRALAISPDGRWLAAHDRAQVVLHDIASGRLLARMETREAIALSFSSDGEQLLVLLPSGLEVWTLTRENRRLALTKKRDVPAPKGRTFVSGRMLQDGERFLASTQKLKPYSELWRLRRDELKWERQPAPESPNAGITDVTPDGVFNIGGQNQFNVINNIKLMKFCVPEPANLKSALGAFSPDGKTLVMVDVLHGFTFYPENEWLHPRAYQPAEQTLKVSGSVSGAQMPAWARSGRWVAMSPDGRRVSLVDATTHQTHLTLESPIDLMLDTMTISEDERTLVLQRRGGSIEIWYLEKLVRELQALGVATTLPMPNTAKATPPTLLGDYDEMPLPEWLPIGRVPKP